MYYLTEAGVNFLNEVAPKKPRSGKPKSYGGNLVNLPYYQQKTSSGPDTNLSKNNPGHEERMKAHQARIDARAAVNKKMGREVDEARGDQLMKGLGIQFWRGDGEDN
jgi:hypothetical protein